MSAVTERVRGMICELLVLRDEDVRAESLLVDELDIDSIALIELVFSVEKEFDVEFPDVKATGEAFGALLPDAFRKMTGGTGTATLFEFIRDDAIRHAGGDALGAEARDELFNGLTLGELARAVAGRVPTHLDPEARLSTVRLGELLRVITVETMGRYVAYLRASTPRTSA